MGEPTLWDQPRRPSPAAPRAQRAGRNFAAAESGSVLGHIASFLREAGPVRVIGGEVLGGGTIQECAEAVTQRRGRLTKETTCCQPLKDLRGGRNGLQFEVRVRDSGYTRIGNAGAPNTVWEWIFDTTSAGGVR